MSPMCSSSAFRTSVWTELKRVTWTSIEACSRSCPRNALTVVARTNESTALTSESGMSAPPSRRGT
jgi:ferredoxin